MLAEHKIRLYNHLIISPGIRHGLFRAYTSDQFDIDRKLNQILEVIRTTANICQDQPVDMVELGMIAQRGLDNDGICSDDYTKLASRMQLLFTPGSVYIPVYKYMWRFECVDGYHIINPIARQRLTIYARNLAFLRILHQVPIDYYTYIKLHPHLMHFYQFTNIHDDCKDEDDYSIRVKELTPTQRSYIEHCIDFTVY